MRLNEQLGVELDLDALCSATAAELGRALREHGPCEECAFYRWAEREASEGGPTTTQGRP